MNDLNDGEHTRSRPQTFSSRFNPTDNNFDLLRLLLAAIVVFDHCFSLTGSDWEPIGAFLHYGYGGSLAVDCFLVISGFLVCRSVTERSLGDYLASRVLRIIPGLAVVTIFEVFVGMAFTSASAWIYLTFVGFRHLSNVFVFGLDAQLYSVFGDTDPPWMMNGSLWTIPIECSFYILLPLISLIAGLRRSLGALFLMSLVGLQAAKYFDLSFDRPGPAIFLNVHLFPFLDLGSFFLAGAWAWIERSRVPFTLGALALCFIGLYAARDAMLSEIALKVLLPYIVLYLSMAGAIGSKLKRAIGDLSYGTYLFGFPVTLAVIAATGGALTVYRLFGVVLCITLLLAWLSWHLVEGPSLKLKRLYTRD